MKMNEDSFYHYTGLNPVVKVNEENTGYDITIPAPEYEAKNIQLVGFDRQLKLTMDRDFDYKNTSEDGSTTNLKKNETLTSKIPIDYIVDPKSVTRSYQDGNLLFKINFA
jgi:HSP20 family molecular chaperone IbpA